MTFEEIDQFVKISRYPLGDKELEEIDAEKHPYHRLLYHLTSYMQPKVILELGTWHGVGSYYISKAADHYGGMAVAVDLNKPRFSRQFKFVQGDSSSIVVWDEVSAIVDQHGPIGLVYQDSSHHYAISVKEWFMYSKFLDDEYVWVCDDITQEFHDPKIDPPGKSMVEYFMEIPVPDEKKSLYPDVLHYGNCQGIIIS